MKKIILATLIFCSFGNVVSAQKTYNSTGATVSYNDGKFNRMSGVMDRLILGIDLSSLNPYFFNNTFQIGFRPLIGYEINDIISSGISLGFNYLSQRNVYGLYDPNGNLVYKPYRYYNYAGGVWTRVNVVQNYFIHVEYERNLLQEKTWANVGPNIESFTDNTWVNCVLIGGGFKQQVSDKVSITTSLLYDLLQNTAANTRTTSNGRPYSISPYGGRIEYRFGLNFGF